MTTPAPDRTWRSLLDPGGADDLFRFDPPAYPLRHDRFDRGDARLLAELCRVVYQRAPDRRRTEVARAGLVEATFVELGPVGAGAYVAAAGGLGGVLVFRGTASIGGWMTNLDIRRAPDSIGGSVHRGFLEAWLHAAATIRACIAGLPRPLVVTGHSLGGALAVLAHRDLGADLTVTFGAPKVGDAAFARGFTRAPVYRVVNGRDVVPTLPPIPVYRHVGRPRRVGRSLSFRVGRALRGAVNAFREGRIEDLKGSLREAPEPLSDHAPVNYVAALAPR